jgi:glycosyltransferase involved in cell wall biosynthesis
MADCSISIIIPAYNVEKYLKAAMDSIKEQSELPDEVILIDDGSTDRTLKVAKAFEFPVPYQVVSIENGGQGNARNLGVSLASSEYVHFFDSDDLLTKNFISSIKDQIRHNKCPDIILFSGKSFNDNEYQGNRWVNYCRFFLFYPPISPKNPTYSYIF